MTVSHWPGRHFTAALLASATLVPVPVAAQSVAPTREELTRITTPEEAPRSTLNIVGGIERSPCPLADPRYADVKVTIREAAATILRDKGYLAAVQVPTQRIENGVVRMETLYARITTIRARGQTS